MKRKIIEIIVLALIITISVGIIGCSNSSQEDESQIPESVVNEDEEAIDVSKEEIDEFLNEVNQDSENADTSDYTEEQVKDVETETTDVVLNVTEEEKEALPEDIKELIEIIENTESIEDVINSNDNSNEVISPEEPINPEDDSQNESTSANNVRTDAEVKKVMTDFANNFKNTSTFSNLSGVAAEYVDENLNTIKNNPESNESLKSAIAFYKEGSYTEEMFLFAIESWIEIGGPYGSKKITVQ